MFSSAVRVVRRGWIIRFGARETLIFFLPATFLTRSGLKISCTKLKKCKNTRVSATRTRRLFSAATQDDSTRFLKGNNRAINKRSTVEFPFVGRSAVAAGLQSRSHAETRLCLLDNGKADYGSACTDRKRLNRSRKSHLNRRAYGKAKYPLPDSVHLMGVAFAQFCRTSQGSQDRLRAGDQYQ